MALPTDAEAVWSLAAPAIATNLVAPSCDWNSFRTVHELR